MNRGCWVKYGVDPRSDVSFRIFQTMDMRSVNARSAKTVKKIVKAKEAKKLLKLDHVNDSYVEPLSSKSNVNVSLGNHMYLMAAITRIVAHFNLLILCILI